MSKTTTGATPNYEHITPDLLARVTEVIGEADKHVYSVSRIYTAYNAVFKKNDAHQVCSSCLRNRVKELKNWYAEYAAAAQGLPEVPPTVANDAAGITAETGGNAQITEPVAVTTDAAPHEKLFREFMEARGITQGTPQDSPEAQGALIEFLEVHGAGLPDEYRGWVEAAIAQANGEKKPTPQYTDPAAPGYVAPAEGVTRIAMSGDALPFDFTPNEAVEKLEVGAKGKVVNADGTTVKAGTYTSADGFLIGVQPGGRAAIKGAPVEEDLT